MRALVISDIHGNLAALQAVLSAGTKERPDSIICLGDLVGYGPNPDDCVSLIMKEATVILGGNHDLAATGRLHLSYFSHHARKALEWTKAHIAASTVKSLSALQPQREYKDLLLSHGGPIHPVWDYILSTEDADAAMKSISFSCCLFGHTHLPSAFVKNEGDGESSAEYLYGTPSLSINIKSKRILLNPGSVGFPRDYKDSHEARELGHSIAQYGILDTDSGFWRFLRVAYDMRQSAKLMIQYGLW